MEFLLPTLSDKRAVDSMIRDTIDKVLVLRFGRSSDGVCLQLDDVLYKSARDVSRFVTVALVDVDSEEIQVYVKYFDITFIPSTIFFFNAHHMKVDSGSADHTKWVGSFRTKQNFVDVVERLCRIMCSKEYSDKPWKFKKFEENIWASNRIQCVNPDKVWLCSIESFQLNYGAWQYIEEP